MNIEKIGLPYENSPIAKFLDKRIDALKGVKTQREIAFAAGYDKPNIISMFKRGDAKVPLDRIPVLAAALEADPAHLLRLALEQYLTGLGSTIDAVFGRIATKNEEEILLRRWRAATMDQDPPSSPEIESVVERMVAEVSATRPAQ